MSHASHTIDTEHASVETHLSDMRRVSMNLAFSPARQRRRKHMAACQSRMRPRLGGWGLRMLARA